MSRSIRSLLPLFLAALVGACGASGPDELKLGPQSSAVEIVPPGVAPIVHTSSSAAPFQQEPELFGYQPAFVPNTVSFDAGNRPYIREFARRPGAPCGAGDWDSAPVRATDSTGAWLGLPLTDLADQVRAKVLPAGSHDGCFRGGRNFEERIVFDAAGSAYTFFDAANGPSRIGILLYSTDRGVTWTPYFLPDVPWGWMARLEFKDGNNPLDNPPAILMFPRFAGFDANYPPSVLRMLLPKRGAPESQLLHTLDANGNRVLTGAVTVVSDGILSQQHSGAGNSVVGFGDKVHVIYPVGRTIPGVCPATSGAPGTPVFARTWSRTTNAWTSPTETYVGCAGDDDSGGNGFDNHDDPAVSIDTNGTLHAVLGAHHGTFQYTRTTTANSTLAWTTPVKFGQPRPTPDGAYTYVSLICDAQNTLHVVARWAGLGYYFRLVYLRKRSGSSTWDTFATNSTDPSNGGASTLGHKHLVVPFRWGYVVYDHKLTIDNLGRLFLNYETYPWQLSAQDARDYCAKPAWRTELSPSDGQPACSASGGGTGSTLALRKDDPNCTDDVCSYGYHSRAHAPSMLVSDDGGSSWRLAVTSDFAAGQRSYGVYATTAAGGSFSGAPWWSGAVQPFTWPWRDVADVTGDGKVDLVTWANEGNGLYVVPSNGTGFDANQRWYSGNGGPFNWPWRALADVTGDGKADLVTWANEGNGVYVVPSNGASFDFNQRWYSGNAAPFNWPWRALADVNGDGKADLVAWKDQSNGIWVALSDGAGFGGGTWYSGEAPLNWPWRALADVNGDGKADLVLWANEGNGVYVVPSNGAGFDVNQRWYSGGTQPFTWPQRALADVNGDGKADLVTWADEYNGLYVVPAVGNGFGFDQRWYSGRGAPFTGRPLFGSVDGAGPKALISLY